MSPPTASRGCTATAQQLRLPLVATHALSAGAAGSYTLGAINVFYNMLMCPALVLEFSASST